MAIPKTSQSDITTAHEAVAKHGSISAAAKALGIARTTLQGRLKHRPSALLPKVGANKPKVGKSLADFRAAHDKDFIVPSKINAALKQLGNGWEYEADFLRLAAISVSDLAMYRDQFSDHWMVLDRSGKRAWAGTKAFADEMKRRIRG